MKKQKIKYWLLGVTLILLISLFAGCSLPFFSSTSTTTPPPSTTTTSPPETDTTTTGTWTPPVTQTQNPELSDFVAVVNKVKPSVVAINARSNCL